MAAVCYEILPHALKQSTGRFYPSLQNKTKKTKATSSSGAYIPARITVQEQTTSGSGSQGQPPVG